MKNYPHFTFFVRLTIWNNNQLDCLLDSGRFTGHGKFVSRSNQSSVSAVQKEKCFNANKVYEVLDKIRLGCFEINLII